jgi:enoyl-CoA hydratase
MSHEPIRLFTDNNIAFLELACPPGNVMDAAFFECFDRLAGSFNRLEAAGMIVCSHGRHFSSGADVDKLKSIMNNASRANAVAMLSDNHHAFESLANLSYPVVAAIAGCCLGGGLELALACHYRIAAPHAVFALPEATFGIMPGCGGTVRLPERIGIGKAVEFILSGRTISADEALKSGLVDILVNKKELTAAAIRLIDKINKRS